MPLARRNPNCTAAYVGPPSKMRSDVVQEDASTAAIGMLGFEALLAYLSPEWECSWYNVGLALVASKSLRSRFHTTSAKNKAKSSQLRGQFGSAPGRDGIRVQNLDSLRRDESREEDEAKRRWWWSARRGAWRKCRACRALPRHCRGVDAAGPNMNPSHGVYTDFTPPEMPQPKFNLNIFLGWKASARVMGARQWRGSGTSILCTAAALRGNGAAMRVDVAAPPELNTSPGSMPTKFFMNRARGGWYSVLKRISEAIQPRLRSAVNFLPTGTRERRTPIPQQQIREENAERVLLRLVRKCQWRGREIQTISLHTLEHGIGLTARVDGLLDFGGSTLWFLVKSLLRCVNSDTPWLSYHGRAARWRQNTTTDAPKERAAFSRQVLNTIRAFVQINSQLISRLVGTFGSVKVQFDPGESVQWFWWDTLFGHLEYSLGKANNTYSALTKQSVKSYTLRGILPRQNTATASSMQRSITVPNTQPSMVAQQLQAARDSPGQKDFYSFAGSSNVLPTVVNILQEDRPIPWLARHCRGKTQPRASMRVNAASMRGSAAAVAAFSPSPQEEAVAFFGTTQLASSSAPLHGSVPTGSTAGTAKM
ncbi:hypothetical protein C8R47DRAFT_1067530 [Mycena vitilis]|nr:hypothetical protein C8R47DRAFT_1067530 [Mycena vitilis]